MTYENRELSPYNSEPVELYEFSYATKIWRYTSADDDQTYLSQVFKTLPISRGDIEQTQEMNRSDMEIEMPEDVDIASEFEIYPPAEVMLVRIYRQHRGESETALIWIGRVLNSEGRDGLFILHCESAFTSLRRTGLRRLYSIQCPHVLYGRRCGAVQNVFKTTGFIESMSLNTLTIEEASTKDDGYFDGGMLEFLDLDGITHRRAITAHIGSDITISAQIRQLDEEGSPVNIYPGCAHTKEDCIDKFSNRINYGGFDFSPDMNPFDGKTLF